MDNKQQYNLKILYVEDEPDTLEPMARFLRRRFSKVMTAANGQDGLAAFQQFQPDIIITDLLMPGIGGLELIEKIRHSGCHSPVVITSALQDVASILQTVDCGISKYIIKPIDLDELARCLDKIAEGIYSNQDHLSGLSGVEKKETENKLKAIFSSILKNNIGKGPRDIKIFIGNPTIEIFCYNVLTPYETTLLSNNQNIGLVEQSRHLIYRVLQKEIEDSFSEALSFAVQVSLVKTDARHDTDFLLLIPAVTKDLLI
jgi:YesN/AraC family two-component response regulator